MVATMTDKAQPDDKYLHPLERMARRVEERWKAEGITQVEPPSPDSKLIATFPMTNRLKK